MSVRAVSVVAVVCAVLVSCAPASQEGPKLERAAFVVEGMHCDGCSTSIKADLRAVEGVEQAEADHEAGTAMATFDSRKVHPEDLKTVIEDLGYTVTSIATSPVVDG
jgi:copper chaperone